MGRWASHIPEGIRTLTPALTPRWASKSAIAFAKQTASSRERISARASVPANTSQRRCASKIEYQTAIASPQAASGEWRLPVSCREHLAALGMRSESSTGGYRIFSGVPPLPGRLERYQRGVRFWPQQIPRLGMRDSAAQPFSFRPSTVHFMQLAAFPASPCAGQRRAPPERPFPTPPTAGAPSERDSVVLSLERQRHPRAACRQRRSQTNTDRQEVRIPGGLR